MNTKQIKEFLPLGVLSLIGFASIIQVLLTNYIFDYRQYIGLSLLMVCGIFFFTNKKLYRYFLGITLILGTFNLIAFSTYIFAFFLIFFPLQILPFVVFILYLIYRKRIFGLFFRSFQKSEEEEKEYYNRKLKRFKEKFAELTDAEIDYRLNQELVPEAKQALIEIKKNRN